MEKSKNTRYKSPILIALCALADNFDKNSLFDVLLKETKNKENIQAKEFSTLTIAMIAAIGILKLQNDDYNNQLKYIVHNHWTEEAINDLNSILDSEGSEFAI